MPGRISALTRHKRKSLKKTDKRIILHLPETCRTLNSAERRQLFKLTKNVMKIKIHEESDLFSDYDPDQKMLTEDIFEYIFRSFQQMKSGRKEDHEIHICSDLPVNEENVTEKIRQFFRSEKAILNQTLKKMYLKAGCLFAFGLLALTLWLYFSGQDTNLNLEILSIIGWVAIWEAASIILMDRQAVARSKKDMDKIINSKIIFHSPDA